MAPIGEAAVGIQTSAVMFYADRDKSGALYIARMGFNHPNGKRERWHLNEDGFITRYTLYEGPRGNCVTAEDWPEGNTFVDIDRPDLIPIHNEMLAKAEAKAQEQAEGN